MTVIFRQLADRSERQQAATFFVTALLMLACCMHTIDAAC